jgi:hypothetical protein
MFRRSRQRIWPTFTDYESAQAAVRYAVKACTIWAIVSVGMGIVSLVSGSAVKDSAYNGESVPYAALTWIVSGVLFGVIAWKVRNMSRNWAIVGLLIAAAGLWGDPASGRNPIVVFCYLYVVLSFVNAIRASIFWSRLEATETARLTDAERLGQ